LSDVILLTIKMENVPNGDVKNGQTGQATASQVDLQLQTIV